MNELMVVPQRTQARSAAAPTGGGRRRLNKRNLFVLLFAAFSVLAALAALGYFLCAKFGEKDGGTVYREMTVERGDLTQGITESGTAALTQVQVSYAVAADIEKIPVKSGAKVEKGDVIVQLDKSTVQSAINDMQTEYDQKVAEMRELEGEQGIKLTEAEQSRKTSQNLEVTAPKSKELAVKKAQNSLNTAKLNVQDAQKELEKHQAMQLTFDADYAHLKELEQWRDDAKALSDSFSQTLGKYTEQTSETLTEAESLEKAVKTATDALATAKQNYDYTLLTNGNVNQADYYVKNDEGNEEFDSDAYTKAVQKKIKEAYDAVTKAEYNLSVANQRYAAYSGTQTGIENESDFVEGEASGYSAEYENFNKAYTDFAEQFKRDYDGIEERADLDEKVESLEETLQKAEKSLSQAETDAALAVLQAEQTLQSSLVTAETADAKYEATVLQYQSAVDVKALAVENLREKLDETLEKTADGGDIASPVRGIVTNVYYAEGDTVNAGQTIMTVSDSRYIYVDVALSEEDITQVELKQQASVTLSGYDEPFAAEVESITTEPARAASASVSYTVRVRLTDEYIGSVYEGMSAEVTIIKAQKKDAVYVAKNAVQGGGREGSYVYVKNAEGKPERRDIETGFSNDRYIEVVSGLLEGDTLMLPISTGTGKSAKSAGRASKSADTAAKQSADSAMPSGEMPSFGEGGAAAQRPSESGSRQ